MTTTDRLLFLCAVLAAALALTVPVHAAELRLLSVSSEPLNVRPGETFSAVVMYQAAGSVVASLQGELVLPSNVTMDSITVASEAAAAQKELFTYLQKFLLAGMTANVIPTGSLATVTFRVAPNASPGLTAVALTGLLGANPIGDAVAILPGIDLAVTILGTLGDLDGDGDVDRDDFLTMIRQIIGVAPCTDDLTGDGACTVLDLMQLLRAMP